MASTGINKLPVVQFAVEVHPFSLLWYMGNFDTVGYFDNYFDTHFDNMIVDNYKIEGNSDIVDMLMKFEVDGYLYKKGNLDLLLVLVDHNDVDHIDDNTDLFQGYRC